MRSDAIFTLQNGQIQRLPGASVLLKTPDYFNHPPNFPECPYSSGRLSYMSVFFFPLCSPWTLICLSGEQLITDITNHYKQKVYVRSKPSRGLVVFLKSQFDLLPPLQNSNTSLQRRAAPSPFTHERTALEGSSLCSHLQPVRRNPKGLF